MFEGASEYAPAWRAWAEALRVQLRVIIALVRRETRAHFGELRLGYLWAIIEPAGHVVIMSAFFIFILRRHIPIRGSMMLFFLTGLIPYFWYHKLAVYLMGAVNGNRALLNLPSVKPFDVIMSRAIVESWTYFLVGLLLFTVVLLTGAPEAIPRAPLTLAAAIGVTVLIGTGLGMINAALISVIPQWGFFFNNSFGMLYLLSGIFFLIEQVPPPFRDYLLWNPLLHMIIWWRNGFYADYSLAYLDRSYVLWFGVASMVIGLVLIRLFRRNMLDRA